MVFPFFTSAVYLNWEVEKCTVGYDVRVYYIQRVEGLYASTKV